jgi:hypothetical protein
LKRTLTAKHLILLGVGAVIGAGIFVLTGQAAANHAGPAVMLSFVIAGFACAPGGPVLYAEFAAMMPVSGSAYSYSYATLGEGALVHRLVPGAGIPVRLGLGRGGLVGVPDQLHHHHAAHAVPRCP